MDRFTEAPLSVASHFTFICFQWKLMFRLEFFNSVFSATLQVQQAGRRGEAGTTRKRFCVSSCELAGVFFPLSVSVESAWLPSGNSELIRHVTDEAPNFSFSF